jgi:hypothetical protein
MIALRIRVMSASYSARFWLSAFCAALMPTSIGYQDLAALIAHEPGVSANRREHLIASPFGTIEAATFSYSRPTGTALPELLDFQSVNFDPRSLDAYAWKIDEPLTAHLARQIEYPSVSRQHKGDRPPATIPAQSNPANLPQLPLIGAPNAPTALQPMQAPAPVVTPQPNSAEQHVERQDSAPPAAAPPAAQMDAHSDASTVPAPAGPRAVDAADAIAPGSGPAAAQDNARDSAGDDDVTLADRPPEIPAPGETTEASSTFDELSFLDANAGDRSAEIYFGGGVMGSPAGLERWAPGAEPILVPPSADSGIKLSALEGTDTDTGAGETVAGKDDTSRLDSPAQRLGLSGKPLAQAQKCLADAVYFEARGEVLKGQQAVAQVVMNRVFSGYYPHDVCGVVYQNAARHLACQFTFACEGKDLDRINEPDMWEQAKSISKDMLDGKIWLAEVGHATHYHAYWVHPSWVHEMAKLYHLGVHTFYRPLNWGDGGNEPVWGRGASNKADQAEAMRPNPEVTAEKPEPAPQGSEATSVKGPEAAASPEPAAAKSEPTAKL